MMHTATFDEDGIPTTFGGLLDMAGFVEEEREAALYFAGKGKGEDPRADFLARTLQRDLAHYYVLQALTLQADEACKHCETAEEQNTANRAYAEAAHDRDVWIAMLDRRIDELVRLVRLDA